VVEIVPALPEEADALRVRQLAAIRRFLETVAANGKAAGVSGLGDSVSRRNQRTADQQTSTRSSEVKAQKTYGEKVADAAMRFAFLEAGPTTLGRHPLG
jgi:hypothetical protein